MKVKSILKLAILAMSFMTFMSCSIESLKELTNIKTGYFIDSAVAGVDYKTPTQSGVTDANGAYTYRAGERVVFSIGGIELGEVTDSALATPLHLCNSDDENDPKVVNMLVFLQSLDDDGDASNGIHIKKAYRDNAKYVSKHFQDVQDGELDGFINSIGVEANDVVTRDQAKEHFRKTIEQHKSDIEKYKTKHKQSSTTFSVTSDNYQDGGVFAGGANGGSPQYSWSNAPAGTSSYALIMDDISCSVRACVHWNVYNIPKAITYLRENEDFGVIFNIVQGVAWNDRLGYSPPQPPQGEIHTYKTTIYALSASMPTITTTLSLTRDGFENTYRAYILGKATLSGSYPAH